MARREASLAKLRRLRVRPEPDLSLAAAVAPLQRELTKRRRSGGAAETAWERAVPGPLRAKATVLSLSRGVLTVRVPDASARFGLDRFLRSGGQDALIGTSPVAIKRVRIVP